MHAWAVRTSAGNGTAAAPCSATKSVSSIICATRPFGTGRSPRVHLEPSLGSTPTKYESRYGVRPARSSRSRSSSGDMDRVLPRGGAARRSAIEATTNHQIVCGEDRSHASGSASLIVTPGRLRWLLAAWREGGVTASPRSIVAAFGRRRGSSSPPKPVDSASLGTATFNSPVKTATFRACANRFGQLEEPHPNKGPLVKWRGP
jgi:hypothetical protein